MQMSAISYSFLLKYYNRSYESLLSLFRLASIESLELNGWWQIYDMHYVEEESIAHFPWFR